MTEVCKVPLSIGKFYQDAIFVMCLKWMHVTYFYVGLGNLIEILFIKGRKTLIPMYGITRKLF